MTTEALIAHLGTGVTTVCRAWAVKRRDGQEFGFTDHDQTLEFEGLLFKADSGLTARALQQTTGLSVDNSETMGALSDVSVNEEDLIAGRFDAADVRAWLVNWANPSERMLQFRGKIGEISRAGGAFRAELRGLTEALNVPTGKVFQRGCSAILGDLACRFDLTQPGYFAEVSVERIKDRRQFVFAGMQGFDDRWFERGRMIVESGTAKGLIGLVKSDRKTPLGRSIDLWQSLGAEVIPGDVVRIEAGCDKQPVMCRAKFANFVNFRGFPHIPGDDWLMAYPSSDRSQSGGSLFRNGAAP